MIAHICVRCDHMRYYTETVLVCNELQYSTIGSVSRDVE